MTDGMQIREILSKRHTILALLTDEPKTKPELVEQLDCSRATVDRAISELLDIDCIEATEPGGRQFVATHAGVTGLDTYRDYADRTDTLSDATTVLNSLPHDAPLDPAFLQEADVYTAPDPARQPSLDIFADATQFLGVTPVIYQAYFDAHVEKLQDDDFRSEIIIHTDLLDQIKDTYDTEFSDLAGHDSLDLFATDEAVPYSLWLMEQDSQDFAGITTYTDGSINGLIINDTPRAVSWVRSEYTRYKTTATPLTTDHM